MQSARTLAGRDGSEGPASFSGRPYVGQTSPGSGSAHFVAECFFLTQRVVHTGLMPAGVCSVKSSLMNTVISHTVISHTLISSVMKLHSRLSVSAVLQLCMLYYVTGEHSGVGLVLNHTVCILHLRRCSLQVCFAYTLVLVSFT